jgi:ferredoxin
VDTAPDLFDLDDDGCVVVKVERPAEERQVAARDAVAQCPTMAIAVDE